MSNVNSVHTSDPAGREAAGTRRRDFLKTGIGWAGAAAVAMTAPRWLRAADAPGKPVWQVQETAFAGVWRVQHVDPRGRILDDILEAGDMPVVVRESARKASGARLDATQLPEGVMNAPALVNEIRHHSRLHRDGQPAHVLNLSLLPLAPADHEALDQQLGDGTVAILSRGFGNCRINSTRVRAVWRVRYTNSMNTLILDTIEIVDIPEAARAAQDDYDDSMERLGDLLTWLREG